MATAALAGCSSGAAATKAAAVGIRDADDDVGPLGQRRQERRGPAPRLGRTVDLKYAQDDVPTQIAQIQAMIDEGAGALVVGAIDGTALKAVLAKAAAAKIPVVSYDRLIRDTPDIAYYATFDNALSVPSRPTRCSRAWASSTRRVRTRTSPGRSRSS